MRSCEREISKEIYDRAKANHGYIAREDIDKVFDISEQLGYGIYGDQVTERDGKYFVCYERGESCD